MSTDGVPRVLQPYLMERSPLDDEGTCFSRQGSLVWSNRIKHEGCPMITITYMEMRRRMIIPMHEDYHAIETGESRHVSQQDT